LAKRGQKSSTPARLPWVAPRVWEIHYVEARFAGAGNQQASARQIHYAEARFAGAGNQQASSRQRGKRVVWVGEDGNTLAEKGHGAKADKKIQQDGFERDVTFEFLRRLPPEILGNQHVVSKELDRIARSIKDAPLGRRSEEKIRRRVGILRKEFLRFRA
jgi:hypothetical protein